MNKEAVNKQEFERALLMVIRDRQARTGRGLEFLGLNAPGSIQLAAEIARYGIAEKVIWADLQEAAWSLVARSLVWVNMAEMHSPDLWRLHMTSKGEAILSDTQANPDDPMGYMKRLLKGSPKTSAVVQCYLWEALNAFNHDCFLGSAVMLGVAAEASMLDAAGSYVKWAGKSADNFRKTLENRNVFYVRKLQDFQKQLATAKSGFPDDLRDSLELDITAVLQLIRLTRNDAGHPTGRKIDREDCFNHLVVYARAHARLHRLQDFFLSHAVPPVP